MNTALLDFTKFLLKTWSKHNKKISMKLSGEDYIHCLNYTGGLDICYKWVILKLESEHQVITGDFEEKVIVCSIDEVGPLLGQLLWDVCTKKEQKELSIILDECFKALDIINCCVLPFVRVPNTLPSGI